MNPFFVAISIAKFAEHLSRWSKPSQSGSSTVLGLDPTAVLHSWQTAEQWGKHPAELRKFLTQFEVLRLRIRRYEAVDCVVGKLSACYQMIWRSSRQGLAGFQNDVQNRAEM